jgi:3-oxoacyl-[acyl-carrier protein] reductase
MVINVPTASLEGQVALITGAGRGIGRGCAIELGKRGASVIVNYVSSEGPANEVCDIIKGFNNGAKAVAIKADVSKVSEIHRLFEEAKKAFGKINIVMSNSGTESWDKTEEISEEKYDHVFNLNTRAQFFVGQTAYKYIEDNGRIILMSSIAAGLLGVKDHALYNASKMAVIGFIKAFATDFGKRGITVNGVAPGGIKSDMFTQVCFYKTNTGLWILTRHRTRGITSPVARPTGQRRRSRTSWRTTARSEGVRCLRMSRG